MVTIIVVTMIIVSKGRGNIQWPNNITEAFFLSGFTFTNIHDSQENWGRGRLSLIPHGEKLFWPKNIRRGYSKWEG